jgi:hypothetical protein
MSEIRAQGPLDIARQINKTAARVDAVGQEYLDRNPDETGAIIQQLNALNYTHPLAGQEVEVFGISLTISVGEDEPVPYALPVDRKPGIMRGIYNGVTLRTLYDPEEDKYASKLAHMLYTGTGEMELDQYGNLHQTHFYNYVSLYGSEVTPVLPLNAHSLEDLEDDPIAQLVDHIMFDENTTDLEKIKRLGNYVNRALRKQEFSDEKAMNHQRVSYINSMGLHHNLKLAVNDIVLGDADDESDEFSLVSLSGQANIIPVRFEIASGYELVPGGEEALAGGPPELYARTNLPDGRPLLAALKNVLDAQRIESG